MSLFDDDPTGPALQQVAARIESTGSALVRGLQSVATGAAAVAFAPLVLGIGALTVGIVGLTGAIRSATNEATNWSRAMASLRANQGLSNSQSFGLASRNSLFGISPQQTAQMYGGAGMSPMVAGLRGAAAGFGSPYASNYLETAAARYQAMPQMFRNQMLDASYGGRAPDEIRQTLNLRPSQIRSQLAYGSQVQSQMGISPEILARYSAEIPLAAQRIAFAVNTAKIKLAVELAPAIENGAGTVARLLASNAGKIADGLKRGVSFLVEDLPPMLLRGSAGILRGGAALLTGFGLFAQGIAANARPILTIFDAMLRGFGTFVEGLARVGDFVSQTVRRVLEFGDKIGVPGVVRAVGARVSGNDGDAASDQVANGIIGAGAISVGVRAVGAVRGAGAGGGSGAAGGGFLRRLAYAGRSALAMGRYALNGGGLLMAGRSAIGLATAAGVGLGTAAGYGLYRAGQAVGVFDPNKGFTENLADGWGVARDIMTGNPGNYERTLQASRERDAARGKAGGSLNPVIAGMMGSNMAGNPSMVSGLSNLFSGLGSSATNGGASLLGLAEQAEKSAADWPAIIARLEEISKATGETAGNTRPKQLNPGQGERAGYDLVAAVAALMAQRGTNNQLRIP